MLAFASMQAVRENLRARAVSKFALQTASILENADGEQQALREFFSSRNLSFKGKRFTPSNLDYTFKHFEFRFR